MPSTDPQPICARSVRNRGAGGEGESMQRQRRDENSLRVTNLSEDVSEADLQVSDLAWWGRMCVALEAKGFNERARPQHRRQQ